MPKVVEECVDSILRDNPDMSESRAWAICQSQHGKYSIKSLKVKADIPEKYSDIDFRPPQTARDNAQMALDAREDTDNPNDCGTRAGWARANQLASGEELSPDIVKRMSQFARHEDNSEMDDEEGRADCGWMMWKAWGGDEGIEWAERTVDRMEEADQSDKLDTATLDTSDLDADVLDEFVDEHSEWKTYTGNKRGRVWSNDSEGLRIYEKSLEN